MIDREYLPLPIIKKCNEKKIILRSQCRIYFVVFSFFFAFSTRVVARKNPNSVIAVFNFEIFFDHF